MRLRPRPAIAAALVVALALALAMFAGTTPAIPVASQAPSVASQTPSVPSVDAANLVGIYRSGECTLTLDASGTFASDCLDGHARYAVEGDEVLLEQPGGGEHRLTIAGRGRLVSSNGRVFSITGGTP